MVPLNPPLACAPAEDLRPSQVRHFSALKAKKHLRWKLGSCLDTVADKITKRRLEWLGHIARMPEHRIPKMALFGCVRACVCVCVCVCVRTCVCMGRGGAGFQGGRGRVEGQSSEVGAELGGLRGGRGGDGGSETRRGNSTVVPYC